MLFDKSLHILFNEFLYLSHFELCIFLLKFLVKALSVDLVEFLLCFFGLQCVTECFKPFFGLELDIDTFAYDLVKSVR